MRDLMQALKDQGSDHWKVVAQAWDVDLPEAKRDQLAVLVRALLEPERVQRALGELPDAACKALERLQQSGGRMPLANFVHEFGELREMGAARRERERPWLSPASVAETLWYRGWIGRTFAKAPSGPQEYIFIPPDLLALLPPRPGREAARLPLASYFPRSGQPAEGCGTALAEDACSLLAFLRTFPQPGARPPSSWQPGGGLHLHLQVPQALDVLVGLLREIGVVSGSPLVPDAEAAKWFLGLPVRAAAARLLVAWRDSALWNDLAQMRRFTAESSGWPNDPRLARANLASLLALVPIGTWVTLSSFTEAVRQHSPEFQRPLAAFETWALRDAESGTFLRGFEAWDAVEGALLAYLLTGPLHWLGAVDLTGDRAAPAIRLSEIVQSLWQESEPVPSGPESAIPSGSRSRVRVGEDGTLVVPASLAGVDRYQLARSATWVARRGKAYVYRLTPRALERARRQGIRVSHLIGLLERLGGKPLPKALAAALRDWDRRGAQVSLQTLEVIQFSSPELARQLAASSFARGLSRVALGPQSWAIHKEDLARLRSELAKRGLLLDIEEEM